MSTHYLSATKVYAVEGSDLADEVPIVAQQNGWENVIHVIKGKIEEVELPELVDVIVSEWMGSLLIFVNQKKKQSLF